MENADVVVVGASAAGLAAAWSAASRGADVLLLEARREIGNPPGPATVGFDFLWPSEIPRPRHVVARRLEGVRLRASDGRGPLVDAPLTVFDRRKLDELLAAEASKAGARIRTGVAGLEVRDDRSLAVDGFEVRARTVLFADGARTLATRFLRPTRDPASLAWGAVLDVEAAGDDTRLTITLGPHAPGGRSQLVPLGRGRWSHWTFFRGDAAAAPKIAEAALALDARLQGWEAPTTRPSGVAPDPVYTLPGELAAPGVLVAGGAAGQGGLEVGLASGWMAGEAAARDDLRGYERAWRARYQKGYERLRTATDALGRLTDAETKALLGAWNGALLPPEPSASLLARHPKGAFALGFAGWLAWARA